MEPIGIRAQSERLSFWEMIKKNQPYTPPARAMQASRAINRLKVKSVPKALAVDNLAQLSPEWALVFCAEGLLDPSMEVRVMAMRGLGKTKLRPALPPLPRNGALHLRKKVISPCAA